MASLHCNPKWVNRWISDATQRPRELFLKGLSFARHLYVPPWLCKPCVRCKVERWSTFPGWIVPCLFGASKKSFCSTQRQWSRACDPGFFKRRIDHSTRNKLITSIWKTTENHFYQTRQVWLFCVFFFFLLESKYTPLTQTVGSIRCWFRLFSGDGDDKEIRWWHSFPPLGPIWEI